MNINFVLVMTWSYLNANKADAIFIFMNHFRHDRFDETNLRFWSLILEGNVVFSKLVLCELPRKK